MATDGVDQHGNQQDFFNLNAPFRKWYIDDPTVLEATDPAYLCHVCRHIDFKYLILKSTFSQVREEVPLDQLTNILSRSHCAFCRLLKQTLVRHFGIQKVTSWGDEDKYTISMIAMFTNLFKAATTPWKLRIWIKPTPPGSSPNPDLEIHHIEEGSWYGDGTSGKGVIVPAELNLVKALVWIKRCETGFDKCSKKSDHVVVALPKNFRLIDVQKYCVRVVGSSDKVPVYYTLSYKWAQVKYPTLTKISEGQLSDDRGLDALIACLPRTFVDAMELTAKLGERYLWIDSLCIVQDDEQDLNEQLIAMGTIYKQCTLMIAAAYGDDANAGLPGLQSRNTNVTAETIQGLALSPRLLSFEDTVEKSAWNKRAWTYQERLLSPRTLFMTEQQMFFKCEHYEFVQSEDSADWGSQRTNLPYPTSDGGTDVFLYNHSINTLTYRQVVEEYTKRELTYPKDVLRAFAGVSSHLEIVFRSKLLFGLPETELVFALLWKPRDEIKRRLQTDKPLCPSWSWAGWEGPVQYSVRDTLSRVKFVLPDGQLASMESLRQPTSVLPVCDAQNSRTWFQSTWTQDTVRDGPTYWFEYEFNGLAWFAHPNAQIKDRSPAVSLCTSSFSKDPSKQVLRLWAETIHLEFSGWQPPANAQGTQFWLPLTNKDGLNRVGGYIVFPIQYLHEMAGKKLDIVRIARTIGDGSMNSQEAVDEAELLISQLEAGEAVSVSSSAADEQDVLSDLSDSKDISLTRAFFPDRPKYDSKRPGIDAQHFDLTKKSCVYQILLVEWVDLVTTGIDRSSIGIPEDQTEAAQRIGWGTVHIDFWQEEGPVTKLITLI